MEPHLREALALRFPHARQFADVREVGAHNLCPVDVLVGGFSCQDVSSMGASAGLAGARTGLFREVRRIAEEIRPQWLVLENVVGLLTSNGGQDFGVVLRALADPGYVGLWRVASAAVG
ncbi:DNA cytosine methyltransferase [Xylophilus ampelinus]|uniref:DNA cytosine methyltransferase n=1 Tax=Xylophilus ampelinus TaxID=54067 RepID=UPI0035BBBBD9